MNGKMDFFAALAALARLPQLIETDELWRFSGGA